MISKDNSLYYRDFIRSIKEALKDERTRGILIEVLNLTFKNENIQVKDLNK